MSDNGHSTTIEQRTHECLALAACVSGPERDRYLAEAEGLREVAAGQPANKQAFTDPERQRAYERGRQDGETILRLARKERL